MVKIINEKSSNLLNIIVVVVLVGLLLFSVFTQYRQKDLAQNSINELQTDLLIAKQNAELETLKYQTQLQAQQLVVSRETEETKELLEALHRDLLRQAKKIEELETAEKDAKDKLVLATAVVSDAQATKEQLQQATEQLQQIQDAQENVQQVAEEYGAQLVQQVVADSRTRFFRPALAPIIR